MRRHHLKAPTSAQRKGCSPPTAPTEGPQSRGTASREATGSSLLVPELYLGLCNDLPGRGRKPQGRGQGPIIAQEAGLRGPTPRLWGGHRASAGSRKVEPVPFSEDELALGLPGGSQQTSCPRFEVGPGSRTTNHPCAQTPARGRRGVPQGGRPSPRCTPREGGVHRGGGRAGKVAGRGQAPGLRARCCHHLPSAGSASQMTMLCLLSEASNVGPTSQTRVFSTSLQDGF